MKRVFRFAKSGPEDALRRRAKSDPTLFGPLHMLRDADCFIPVTAALADTHRFAGTLLDLPDVFRGPTDSNGRLEAASIDSYCAVLNPEDLVVLTTRPALDDELRDGPRALERTDTPFEKAVHAALRPVFRRLNRCEVTIGDGVELVPPWDKRRAVTFRTNTPIVFEKETKWQGRPRALFDSPWRDDHEFVGWTAGYVVYLPNWQLTGQTVQKTTQLLVSFGMGGTTNLLWSNLLFQHLAKPLAEMIASERASLLIGEFPLWVPTTARPADLGFLQYYDVDYVIAPVNDRSSQAK